MCTYAVDIPIDTTETEQVVARPTNISGFTVTATPSPISVAGTLDVTGQDAISIGISDSTVESITNTGTIAASDGKSGINNAGSITKVVNAQGSGNSAGPLTYTGFLPSRYEIIVRSPTEYGILKADNVSIPFGGTAFGIYAGNISGISSSVLSATTYTGVLQGFTSLSGITNTSGTFGDSFNYSLVQQAATTNWDLVVASNSLPEITANSTVELSSVGVTVEPIFDGGTLLLADGDQSNLDFLVGSAGGIITAPNTGSAELSGVLSGSGALTFNGAATTVLSGANTHSGGSTVASGTLQGDAASLQGDIVNNGAVVFNQMTNGTYAGSVTGTGSLTKNGAGTLTLSGNNTYIGSTTVNGGTLKFDATSAIPIGALAVGAEGAVDLNNFDYTVTDFSGAGSIILGRATLTVGSTSDTTFTGVISGAGGLTKDGIGTLALSGANTYSGGTTVASGTLSVAGSSPTGTGNVVVGPDGSLSGSGTIIGQLIVSGRLKPGNSPGYLETSADVTLKTGSTYVQDIAGSTQANDRSPVGASGYYSYLNIEGGELLIETGTTLTPRLANLFTAQQSGYGSNPYTPVLGDRFRIITASEGIEGRFSNVAQPEELTEGTAFAVFYDIGGSNSIDVGVIPSSYTQTITTMSGNQNAVSVGAALDQIARANRLGISTQTQDELLSAIATQRSASAIAGYAQGLSGEVYAANVAVSAQTSQRLHQTVRGQLNLTRPASRESSNLGLSLNDTDTSVPLQNFDATRHIWGSATYQRGARSSDDRSNGWNSNLYQLAFGADLYRSGNVQLGAGFSLSNTSLNPTYGSSLIQQGSIFAYSKMSVQTYVIDAVASLGLGSSDISRTDVTGISNGFNDSSVYGKDAMISVGISRPIEMRNMYLTPYAQLTWQGAIQEGVSEGASPAALTVNRFTGSAVRGVVGLATSSKGSNPATEKYTYGAYIGIGADSNNLLNPTLSASLANVNTNISTPSAAKVFAQAGWYGTVRLSKTAIAYLGISGEARERQTIGSVNAGLRVQF